MALLTENEYKSYCERYNIAWKYLSSCSFEKNSVIDMICDMRGYSKDSNMPNMLNEIGFIYLNQEIFNKDKLKGVDKDGDLGLFSNEGNFLLLNRFIFPVKDMLGNIIALIGWFPDEKKYITTPSKLFSKKCLFFGMEQLSKTGIGKDYFLVEGIFDSISIRSLGFNCVALMGINASNYTEVLYSLFKRIVAIPDNDKEGRKVLKNDAWRLPCNSKYLRLISDLKDIDDIIKNYNMVDTLIDVWKEQDRIVTLKF